MIVGDVFRDLFYLSKSILCIMIIKETDFCKKINGLKNTQKEWSKDYKKK